jgi:SAM-dependent methyltransferase
VSLDDYAGMLFHSRRIERFQRAISKTVDPGDRVLEVGTGLGTYAFFAVQSGASAVTAIESDRVIHVAESLARANDMEGAIRFVRGKAPEDIPPGKFDVIIFEDFPTNFVDSNTFRLLRILESEHLAEGGRFLPGAARLCLAPVPVSGMPQAIGDPGMVVAPSGPLFGLDWSELTPLLANTGRKSFLAPGTVAADPNVGTSFSIVPPPAIADLRSTAEWYDTDGMIGGILLWFDLDLGEGGWVTNAPSENPEPWGQWLLPLDAPIQANGTSPLEAVVWWERLEDGLPGWMAWECRCGSEVRRGHEFAGIPLGSADLGLPAETSGDPAEP